MTDLEGALRRFAARLVEDRDFIASSLALFKASQRLDDAGLAELLDTTLGNLTRLALCKVPDLGAHDAGKKIQAIADHCSVDAPALANLLRTVDSMDVLRAAPVDSDWLAAARDDDTQRPFDESADSDETHD